MNRFPVRAAPIVAALGTLALFVSACGSSDSSAPADATAMSFKLTDAGCDPHNAKAAAGPINFEIENDGSGSVTELEILDGETILGEKENLTEGLSGSFALTLEEGEYVLRCNGGEEEDGTLTVTGKLKTETSPEVEKAIASYRDYLEKNTAELTAETKPFVAAVVAGDVARAKSLYAAARIPYERIEPVAESFGDLDPRIDARANDIKKSEFGGFHRIEKALWEEGMAKGMAPVAQQLQADVAELTAKVKTVDLQAVQIANGANELLGEVSASKITGEEERYSHIDLVDFEANVEGAEAAFDAVEPLLSATDSQLAREIEADFETVYAALEPYRRGDGFVSYTELTKADTRKLAQTIDILAEKLSQVPAAIVSEQS
ncbi:MAG: iron uptake system component EfeO [Solirubrobacterales bacterium]|jgi:iron uptake system component EfeO|nr:iron uptake system component EfeO [Solirubrobacterales bacterium]